MKRKLAIAFLSAAVCLASQAQAQMHRPPDGVTPIDPNGSGPPQRAQLPPDPEGKAAELRLEGKCAQAIPILRSLSADERDDIAHYNLGQCLLDVSKADPDPQHAARSNREGVQWLLKAANKGLPNAQSSLVNAYLDGSGVPRDPIEAGKWSLIYHSNGMRLAIGMKDISPALQARLDGALTDQTWDEARSRADEWTPLDPSKDD